MVQPLLCYLVVVASGRSLVAPLLHMVTEWAPRLPMPPQIMHLQFDTTPPTSIPSTAACSLSGCRAEEGTAVGLWGTGEAETPIVT